MARPKGFEPLTPRFVVCPNSLKLGPFPANYGISGVLQNNRLGSLLQTKTGPISGSRREMAAILTASIALERVRNNRSEAGPDPPDHPPLALDPEPLTT